MAKLSFVSSASIGAISLGISTAVAAGYSHLHSPLIRRDFFPLVSRGPGRRQLHQRRATTVVNAVTERSDIATGQLLRRKIQGEEGGEEGEVNEDCPGTPYLWKIVEDATGKHVGFGVGTMHLPHDVVLTEASYNSIRSAIEDSCDVYAELNFFDGNVSAAIEECYSSVIANSATIEDIPDEGLRDEIRAKILEVTIAHIESDPEAAAILASRLEYLPLYDIVRFIQLGNTPEFMAKYNQTLYSSQLVIAMDLDILAFGRPGGGLEEVSTQCQILQSIYLTAEELNTTELITTLRNSINDDYSQMIHLYKCGDIDALASSLSVEFSNVDGVDFIINDRNKQMAAKIAQLLDEDDSNERILFAVGTAHWIMGGDDSLESLLLDYGYSLVHIPEWDKDQVESHTNEYCDVMLDSETGLFVYDPDVDVPGSTPAPTPLDVLSGNAPPPTDEDFVLEEGTISPTNMPSLGATVEEVGSEPTSPSTSGSNVIGTPRRMNFVGGWLIFLALHYI